MEERVNHLQDHKIVALFNLEAFADVKFSFYINIKILFPKI